jgi:hypothetical protein
VVHVGRLQPVQFVTLTSHEKLQSAELTFAVLAKAWNKLNRRAKREAERLGYTAYYVSIPEQHKSGRWHLHMLYSPALPLRFWKDNARASGLGYQCAVRDFEAHGRAGQYMLKYLRKSLKTSVNGWAKSMRRIRHSNNWPISEQNKRTNKDWEWDILPKEVSLRDEIDRLIEAGYRVTVSDSIVDE